MQYIYAAMLLHSTGKEITEASVEKVLSGVGVEVDKAKVKSLVEALKEVNIEEVIKQASTAVVVAPAGSSAPAKAEEPKEEKKTEEEAAAGLGSLFG